MSLIRWISTSSTDVSATANYSTGAIPVNGDTLILDGTGTANLLLNLNTFAAVTFAAIYIDQANACQIGSISAAGVATYFQHASAAVYIGGNTGQGSPTGSTLILLDSGSTSCAVAVYDSASSSAANPYLPPIQLKGTAITLDQTGGNVAIAARGTETSTLVSGTIAKGNGKSVSTPNLYLGQGVTVTALTMAAGTVLNRATPTIAAATINGGTYTYTGTGAHTALNTGFNGICYYSGTGTVTALANAGQFDRTQDGRTMTLTATTLYRGAKFYLDNGKAGSTIRTAAPVLVDCSMQDIQWSSPVGDLI